MSGSLAGEGPTGTAIRGGVRWGVTSQVLTQVLSLVATVVLARLLTPGDLGVVAFAQSFVGVVSIGMAWGFGAPLIRDERPTRAEVDGAFWASVMVGFALTLLGVGAALMFGDALGDPRGQRAVAVLMPMLLLNTVATVPAAMLQRRMQFGKFYGTQLSGTFVYVTLELVLAWLGYGPWAVIIGLLVSSVVTSVLTIAFARLRISLASPLRWLSVQRRLAAGWLAMQGASSLNKNVDYWLVGVVLGAGSLGRYYMAYVLPSIVRLRLSWVLGTVLLPVFARVEPRSAELVTAYRRSTTLQMGVGAPMLLGMATVAEPLLRVGVGERWTPGAPVLTLISVAMLLELLSIAPQRMALAKTRLRPIVYSELVGLAVLLGTAASLLTWWRELPAVAAAVLAGRTVSLICSMRWVAAPYGIGPHLIWRELLATLSSAIVMAGAAVAAGQLAQQLGAPPVVELAGAVAAGALTYFVVLALVFRPVFRRVRNDLGLIIKGR